LAMRGQTQKEIRRTRIKTNDLVALCLKSTELESIIGV
jgi:hypothetical protein